VIREMTLVEVLDPVSGPVLALINNQAFTPTVASGSMAKPAANSVERWDVVNTTGDAHPIHLHLVQFQILNRQKLDAPKYAAAAYPTLGPTSFGNGPWPALPVAPFLQGGTTGPDPNERGWKDTFRAMPGEVTRIVVPFSGNVGGPYSVPAGGPFTGPYVWHCHILEHEDHDMMQPYRVV
jgi:FtsP/CotA-like multicopper oxidase with cupredoxin domain